MGEATLGRSPDPDVEPRRRHAAAADPHGADGLTAHRVLDLDLVGLKARTHTPDGDVPAAVHDKPREATEPMSQSIGAKALARPAGVESHAGRTTHELGGPIDDDLAPARARICPRGTPGGRRREGLRQRRRVAAVERARVPSPFEVTDER